MDKIAFDEKQLDSVGQIWKSKILGFLNDMDFGLRLHPANPNINITKIHRIGCDLYLDFSMDGNNKGLVEFWRFVFSGHFYHLANHLETICAKCGCDKGLPASSTVRPGLCEKCRKSLTKEDFKDTVAICMTGKAGSGKDTVTDYLVKNHGFIRMALADPLRDIVQLTLVMDRENVWDRKLREIPLVGLPDLSKEYIRSKEAGFEERDEECEYKSEDLWTVRKLLQYIGTELFRNNISRSIWVRNMAQRLEPGNNYVLSDVRFPNELSQMRKKFGGKTLFIEVVRNGCDGKNVGIENHESERYHLPADIVIENNGTLEDLYTKIGNILKENNIA